MPTKRKLAWLAVTPFLLVSLLLGFWRLRFVLEENHLRAALRAVGLATSGTEVNKWYATVPDSENAAIVLDPAFKLLCDLPDKRSNWEATPSLDRREQWSMETRTLVTQYVTMNAEALAVAREGVRREKCRYPVDFSEKNLLLPHLAKVKGLALRAGLRASLAAEEKRGADCMADIQLMLQLAHTLDREPGIVSQKVRNAIIMMSAQTAERALNLMVFDEIADDALAKAFSNSAGTNSVHAALTGEVGIQMEYFSTAWVFVRGIEMNSFFAVVETNLALSALGPPASLKMAEIAEDHAKMALKKDFFLHDVFCNGLAGMAANDALTLARIRLVQTAFALEHFRLNQGHLPEKLNELTPRFLSGVPADPFDGAPLRYRRLPRGYMIYSIGDVDHDDGGLEKPKANPSYSAVAIVPVAAPAPGQQQTTERTPYDLTFIVER